MAAVGRVNADPQHRRRQAPERGGGGEGRRKPGAGPAGPGDDRSAHQLAPLGWRPHAPMIFGEGHGTLFESLDSSSPVQPGGSDEAIDIAAENAGDQAPARMDALDRRSAGQAKELAFAGSQETRPDLIRHACVACFVAVEMAVQKHLDALVGPAPKPTGEGRSGNDRRVAPMVRNDQHRQPLADVGGEQIEQPVDLGLEAGRDVVDRHKQGWWRASSHCAAM